MSNNKQSSVDLLNKALFHITTNAPTVVIGGRISFIARGLLDRNPKDIDLFFGEYCSLNKVGLLSCNIDEIGSDTITDINGKEIQRTSMKIMGVNVCCFKVDLDFLKYDKIKYNGIEINAQNPEYGIIAKKIYAQKNDKHKRDLQIILSRYINNEQ
jgi:hypothetical protein